MGRPKQRQICPRRLEVIIEKLHQAKESFEPNTPEWLILDNCQREIKTLLTQCLAS